MRILITYFLLLQSFIGLSQSSFYNEIGKNGIQYKNFKWKVIYSNNFELYFNDGSENIANIALDHIEENFSNHAYSKKMLQIHQNILYIDGLRAVN